MKRFTHNIFIFILTFLSLISLNVIAVETVNFNYSRITNKLQTLLRRSTNLLIIGDSTAERNIIPDSLKNHYSYPINLGWSGGEIVEFQPLINGNTFGNSDVIVSNTVFQVNDNLINNKYFTLSSFNQLKIKDKLCKLGFLTSMEFYISSLSKMLDYRTDKYYPNDGMVLVDKIDVSEYPSISSDNHLFYKDFYMGDNFRYDIYLKSLKEISKNVRRVFIVLPPVNQRFLESCNGCQEIHNEFESRLRNDLVTHKNIYFISLTNSEFSNPDLFYDSHHLNSKGAQLYSSYLNKRLIDESY